MLVRTFAFELQIALFADPAMGPIATKQVASLNYVQWALHRLMSLVLVGVFTATTSYLQLNRIVFHLTTSPGDKSQVMWLVRSQDGDILVRFDKVQKHLLNTTLG
jgi:hypothetical protein